MFCGAAGHPLIPTYLLTYLPKTESTDPVSYRSDPGPVGRVRPQTQYLSLEPDAREWDLSCRRWR